MSTAQTGGGSATHSGTNYQNRVAAWLAVRILAEQDSTPPWDLAASTVLDFLRCETPEPVDDVLVGTSSSGHAFIQAKHSITLGTVDDSDFASVIDQFVKQFHAHPTVHQEPSWNRPLDKNTDRLILVTSSGSSRPVRQILPTVLNRILSLNINQAIDDAATSQEDRDVLQVLQNQISRAWRTQKGVDPTSVEIRQVCSLIRVHTLDVDSDQAQEREAKDLLRMTVLKTATDADLAWSQLVLACAAYAASRTGANRSDLQRVLISSGIDLKSPRSYRPDIEKLKHLSLSTLQNLSSLSEIRIGATQVVKLSRDSTTELRTAALSGSLVVVGQPGAGKSGALHDVARLLDLDGDVLILAVDQFDSESLGSLRNEIGCSHEIIDILRNWPGTKPGFLIIDALDAARTDAGARVFRDLMRSTLAESRWRVIPSIRKFDLRYSVDLKALFKGSPPSIYQDPEFQTIRHFEIPILSASELAQVQQQSNDLGTVISNASSDLLQLLRIPFNLRLIAELIGTGATVNSLTPIRTQIELLERYWQERVLGTDGYGDAREAVLRLGTTEMVKRRTLRIDRSVVASDPSASTPLRQIMSAQLLTEWQPSPHRTPERYVITYAHHILFDYAASRLLFRGPLSQVLAWLESEPDLLLAVRPSLVFHYQYLWYLDQRRQRFWDSVFAFFNSQRIPSTGKIVGPLAAAQLIITIADCQPLLNAMSDEQSPDHGASVETFRHLMGAVPSASIDATRPLTGQNAPPWTELLKEVSAI
jgi:hypothetical protein